MKRVILKGLQEKIEELEELEKKQEDIKKPLEAKMTSLLNEINKEDTPEKITELKEEVENLSKELKDEPSEITELKSEIEKLVNFQDSYNNMLEKISKDESFKATIRSFSIKKDTASFLKIQKYLFINGIIPKEIFIIEHLDLIYIKDNAIFQRNIKEIENLLTFVDIRANVNMVEINNNLNASLKASIIEEMSCKKSYDDESEYEKKQARIKAAKELANKSKATKNRALKSLKESYKAEIINTYGLKF